MSVKPVPVNQNQVVLKHLATNRYIDRYSALGVYGICELRKIISNIRDMDFDIQKTTVRDGRNRPYTRYWLKNEDRSALRKKHGWALEQA